MNEQLIDLENENKESEICIESENIILNGLSIGTVETGEDADATITGNSPNQKLNLVLPRGEQGPQGEKGDTGATGPQGPAGQDGVDGINGTDGEDGITPTIGANGNWFLGEEDTGKPSRGEQGPQGIQGPKGEKGDTGATGPQGPSGQNGTDGINGTDGEDGITPTIGENGNWFLGEEDTGKPSRGEQGPQGIQGPQGEKGDTGATGPQGPAGQDGADGINGTDGEDGITPTIGANGNWFLGDEDTGKPSRGEQGPQGIQGPQGEKGDTGAPGPQGPAGADGEVVQQVYIGENEPIEENVDIWIDPSGDSITIPTKTSDLTNDSGFISSESDPTVPSHVKSITQENINSWNNKSDFSGNYNDLSNKPTISTFSYDSETQTLTITG